jgi:hypothetical protein
MSEYINNRTTRQETLKGLIRRLHEGKTVDEVKGAYLSPLADYHRTEGAKVPSTRQP